MSQSYKCPYCALERRAYHEHFSGCSDDTVIECECGKRYAVTREVFFEFTSTKVPCLNNPRYHKWRKQNNGTERCTACDERRGEVSKEYLRAMGVIE